MERAIGALKANIVKPTMAFPKSSETYSGVSDFFFATSETPAIHLG